MPRSEGHGILRPAPLPVAPPAEALAEARAKLQAAKRPLAIVGVDAVTEGAEAAVATVAALGIPVITTYKAKGLLPESHPMALGGAGLSPKADALLLPLVAEADVILAIGYDPIEMRIGWQNPWDPARQTVIDITAAPNDHYMHHATINIVGQCAATLGALLPASLPPLWESGAPAQTRAALAEAFAPGEGWGPGQVIATCQEVLPSDTLATADSGAHRILLSQMWQCEFPRALTQSSGFCTMGCAVPLAMGAQIVEPDRCVVSFSGDAGFLMVAGEMATAAELRLKTVFVVFVECLAGLDRAEAAPAADDQPGRGFRANGFCGTGAGDGRRRAHRALARRVGNGLAGRASIRNLHADCSADRTESL